ncbi:hypothetical protein [Streptomyces sp. NPDC047071]|uniref:hypothetical protein n=1 Tax=Streptomyces sp. NPDC047071 TaxID=3154808 RepID=UPI003455FCD4
MMAYGPSWDTFDALYPGSIEQMLAVQQLSGSPGADQFKVMVRQHSWDGPLIREAVVTADTLRSRVGTNHHEEHVQCSHLFDHDDVRDLTPLAAIAAVPVIGVPRGLVTSVEALAYAMHVGIQAQATGTGGDVSAEQWREAALRGAESPLLSQLHPSAPDGARAVRSHEAGRCIPVTRALQRPDRIVVLGDQPEDFALAEVLRQTHGAVTWMPWEASVSDMWLFPGRASGQMQVTSASLSVAETQRHIDARWDERPVRHTQPAEVERPFEAVDPLDIDLNHPIMVVLKDAWDQPRSLPASVEPDGSLQTSLSLAAEVPRGLDPDKHRWQITLTAGNHPVPPLAVLGSSTVTATGQNPWETFVRAADGGITYWSHRYDFVPSGASLTGTLASPKLAWPGIKRILHIAASANDTTIRSSPAGKRAAIMERLLGSRTALEALAASPGWPLLHHFTQNTTNHDGPEHSRWKLKSAVVLSWEAIVAHNDDTWNLEARRNQIDQWTSQGVLRRGLILGCGHCPILEFYPLAEISQSYRCRRCGGENQLTKSHWRPAADEPRWFYDLHPAVLELVVNNGDVPLLATRFLRNQHWARQALVCEEFELLKSGNRFVEMDFALATSEDLWLGEAKSNDSLGNSVRERQREAGKLMEGCALVGAAGLILATAKSQWSQGTVETLSSERQGRLRAGKPAPQISLLTDLGTTPKLTALPKT